MRRRYETDIEKIFRESLEKEGFRLGIDFATQFPIKNSYILDFEFPKEKIGIECDGEHWHSSDSSKKRDRFKDYVMMQKGWKIVRFTETEIKKDVSICINTLLKLRKNSV